MRRVDDRGELRSAIETCMREAEGAFGDPTVFIEQAVVRPRHIEVQILADGTGDSEAAEELWLASATAIGAGGSDEHERRKQQLRAGR